MRHVAHHVVIQGLLRRRAAAYLDADADGAGVAVAVGVAGSPGSYGERLFAVIFQIPHGEPQYRRAALGHDRLSADGRFRVLHFAVEVECHHTVVTVCRRRLALAFQHGSRRDGHLCDSQLYPADGLTAALKSQRDRPAGLMAVDGQHQVIHRSVGFLVVVLRGNPHGGILAACCCQVAAVVVGIEVLQRHLSHYHVSRHFQSVVALVQLEAAVLPAVANVCQRVEAVSPSTRSLAPARISQLHRLVAVHLIIQMYAAYCQQVLTLLVAHLCADGVVGCGVSGVEGTGRGPDGGTVNKQRLHHWHAGIDVLGKASLIGRTVQLVGHVGHHTVDGQ